MKLRDRMAQVVENSMLDTNKTAYTATYHPAVGDDISLTVLFQEDDPGEIGHERGRSAMRTATVYASTGELVSPSRDDTITVDSNLWAIAEVVRGGGTWQLRIFRGVPLDSTPSRYLTERLGG